MLLINVALTVLVIVAILLGIDIVRWLLNRSISSGDITQKIILLSALVVLVFLIQEQYLIAWFDISERVNDAIIFIFLILIMIIAFLPYFGAMQRRL